MTIGDRIRAWRKHKDWTQGDLAQRARVSKAAVSQWETGGSKGLKPENLVAVADALDVSLRELITGAAAPSGAADAPQPRRVIDTDLVADILAEIRAMWEPYPTDDELALLIAEGYARFMLQTHDANRATIRAILAKSSLQPTRATSQKSANGRRRPAKADHE